MRRRITLAIVVAFCIGFASVHAEDLSIVSWNVESGGAQPDNLAQRIRDLDGYDLWGLSEVKDYRWARQFAEAAGEDEDARFRYVLGTTGGEDRLAILYNVDRFDLVQKQELHGINPGRVRAPLVAHLRLRDSGQDFLFMVNHLYRGNNTARHEQARQLNHWAKEQELPIIAVGDYNFDWDVEDGDSDHDRGFDNLVKDGVFAWVRPERLIPSQGNPRYKSVLDFVFTSQKAADWSATSEILQTDGVEPNNHQESDHRPVVAEFNLGQAAHRAATPALASTANVIDIGWWNIRDLGVNSRDPTELGQIAHVIKDMEVVAVGELNDQQALPRIAQILGGSWESATTQNKIGRSPQSSEYYGFLWNGARIQRTGDVHVDADPEDTIDREPAFATFATVDGKLDFTVCCVHITWGKTVGVRNAEIRELPNVWNRVHQLLSDDRDVILVGDFNRNVGDDSFDGLLAIDGMRCANAGTGATKIDTSNTYDQIFLSVTHTTEWNGQFGVAPFDETDFGNDDDKAQEAVSDHRPVWITLEVPASDDD